MKKIFIILWVLLSGLSFSYASKQEEYIFYYNECRQIVASDNLTAQEKFGENMCGVFVSSEGDEIHVITRDSNTYGLGLIGEDLSNYIKKYYYRGEKLRVRLSITSSPVYDLKIIFAGRRIANVQSGEYGVEFLGDAHLLKYKTLKNNCTFTSYIPICNKGFYKTITSEIDGVFGKLFFDKQILLSVSAMGLKKELSKTLNVQKKIAELSPKYSDSEKVSFTIEYILYKLDIYQSILQNRSDDLAFQKMYSPSISKLKGVLKKKLLDNLTIRQDDNYTYFYLDSTVVNTVKNDFSNFEDVELATISSANMKQKIVEKYSAKYISDFGKKLILITKNFEKINKYIFINTDTKKRFPFGGEPQNIQKGKLGYYFIVSDTEDQKNYLYLARSTGKLEVLTDVNIEDNLSIESYELGVGKIKVKYYSESRRESYEEEIEVE